MRIFIDSPQGPSLTLDPKQGSISVPPNQKLYIHLHPEGKMKEIARRHNGELVLRNGWICLDYDGEGYLIGVEIVEGDPATGVTECIDYLQPVNPLIQ